MIGGASCIPVFFEQQGVKPLALDHLVNDKSSGNFNISVNRASEIQ